MKKRTNKFAAGIAVAAAAAMVFAAPVSALAGPGHKKPPQPPIQDGHQGDKQHGHQNPQPPIQDGHKGDKQHGHQGDRRYISGKEILTTVIATGVYMLVDSALKKKDDKNPPPPPPPKEEIKKRFFFDNGRGK